jgi:cytochrome b561
MGRSLLYCLGEWMQRQMKQLRPYAKDAAHGIIFILAVAMVIKGALLSSPTDLGLIAAATTLFGLVGIARA